MVITSLSETRLDSFDRSGVERDLGSAHPVLQKRPSGLNPLFLKNQST